MAVSAAVSTAIEPLDPSSERDLDVAARLMTAWWREILGPDEPDFPPLEILHSLHVHRPDVDAVCLLAWHGDEPVGFAIVDIRTGNGNEHMAWVTDLFVLAPHRRRGVGRALLDAVTARARAAGRTLVLSGFEERSADGRAFAEAVGCTITNAEKQNRVRVADIDRALMERWLASSPEGYSLVLVDDVVPEGLLDAFVTLEAAMNDAPRTESLGAFTYTPERRRAAEAEHVESGVRQWFAIARHDASGELAGYTEMLLRPYKPWFVEQGDTAVIAAHRGHGIGRWLKAANALRVLDERPDARVIETWNDGTNRWMLAINTEMGFRPVATWIEAELDLSTASGQSE
jgi:GNAT superfamily N-acetyltransferase